jgi:hypothetical protein
MANLKYDETFPVKVAEYAAKGDTDARIAARLGIALSTFYTYKEQFPEFAEGLLAGRRICYSRVRAMLLKVARGQCRLTTSVYKNGELCKTTVRSLPPNLKAIIYFQKHMRVGKVKPPAQTGSGISILEASPTGQTGQTGQTNLQSAPAQADSGISILEASPTGQTGQTGLTNLQSAPAQRDSGISNLSNRPLCPAGPESMASGGNS